MSTSETEWYPHRKKDLYKVCRCIQGVPKKGNRSSKINYFKDTKFILVNNAL